MTLTVRFTEEAQQDLKRLYGFILDRDDLDWSTAERAINAVQATINSLKHNPLSCRKIINPFLRELLISFGATGYVALFEIEADQTVTVLAIRHQREEDYH